MKKRIIIASIFILALGLIVIINIPKSDSKPTEPNTTNITTISEKTTKTSTTTKKIVKTTKKTTTTQVKTKEGIYKLTHYGPDCKGCSGNTASGYKVSNTIYYNDRIYGQLRIVAMKDIKLYSVIRIKNYDNKDIYAIVLDRGVGSGVIDLLVENEKKASQLGIRKNIEIEVLRSGV